jgi:hypothetical protein
MKSKGSEFKERPGSAGLPRYTPAGRALANALEQLAKQDAHLTLEEVRPETVTRAWRQYVFGRGGAVDRKAYTFFCLDRPRSALRRRDLFVAPSIRYADADHHLPFPGCYFAHYLA